MNSCAIENCNSKVDTNGFCKKHYMRSVRRKTNDHTIIARDNKPMEERFYDKVEKTDNCWNWKACLNSWGYGQFCINYKIYLAHRVSYTWAKGPIPDNMTLDHICRNSKCVNPEHLRIMTMKENILISESASAINKRKTHCIYGHPFDEENTHIQITEKSGKKMVCRICITCRRNKYRKALDGLIRRKG